MKQSALVLIKPDGIKKGLIGTILSKFVSPDLDIIGIQPALPTKPLVEQHYQHIEKEPFFQGVVSYLMGEFHDFRKVLAVVYFGEDAIQRCREIAGATHPEEADPLSVRAGLGRITTKGIFENVVHVSSDEADAEREIKIWFQPEDILGGLYPTQTNNDQERRVWI